MSDLFFSGWSPAYLGGSRAGFHPSGRPKFVLDQALERLRNNNVNLVVEHQIKKRFSFVFKSMQSHAAMYQKPLFTYISYRAATRTL